MMFDTAQTFDDKPFLGEWASEILFAAISLLTVMAFQSSGLSLAAVEELLHTNKLLLYIAITVMPSFLLNRLMATVLRPEPLTCVLLKPLAALAVSLMLLDAMQHVHAQTHVEYLELVLAIGMFTILRLLYDLREKRAMLFPAVADRVMLVGDGSLITPIKTLLQSRPHQYLILEDPAASKQDVDAHSPLNPAKHCENLFERAKSLGANKIVISFKERRGAFPLREMLSCKLCGIEVLDAPSMYERLTHKLALENITPSWFIFCDGFRVTPLLRLGKRMMDLICSAIILLLFAPLAPFVILAIKLDSPGPVFFRQIRVGRGERDFNIYKFRTMCQNAERNGAVWACKNDARVTRVGNFLRKTRIDEIPQLINVIKGDMSFVGPRPERPEFVSNLNAVVPYYSERHFIKPGITGWAQVCYPYGASVEDALEKLRYDLYYIKNISLIFDLLIIFKTISVVLLRKGSR
ncbi:TIGR03013 family XrtA/PEP-CTERM system glycosyltransferase [Megalodesulfovibrio paquesii]